MRARGRAAGGRAASILSLVSIALLGIHATGLATPELLEPARPVTGFLEQSGAPYATDSVGASSISDADSLLLRRAASSGTHRTPEETAQLPQEELSSSTVWGAAAGELPTAPHGRSLAALSLNDFVKQYTVSYTQTCYYRAWVSAVNLGENSVSRSIFLSPMPLTGVWYSHRSPVGGLDSTDWGVLFYRRDFSTGTFGFCATTARPVFMRVDGCFACAEIETGRVGPALKADTDPGVRAPQQVMEAVVQGFTTARRMPIRSWVPAFYVKFCTDAWTTPYNFPTQTYQCKQNTLTVNDAPAVGLRCRDPSQEWQHLGSGHWACRGTANLEGVLFGDCAPPGTTVSGTTVPGPLCRSVGCKSDCGSGNFRAGQCLYADYKCTACVCPRETFLWNRCAGWERGNAPCNSCWDLRPAEAGATVNRNSSAGLSSYRSTADTSFTGYRFVGRPGFYNRYGAGNSSVYYCEASGGWNSRMNADRPWFPQCDPPPRPGALTPYPFADTDTYIWRCAPGFRPPQGPPLPPPPGPAPFGEPAPYDGPPGLVPLNKPSRCPEGTFLNETTGVYSYYRVCHFQRVTIMNLDKGGKSNAPAITVGLFRDWSFTLRGGKFNFKHARFRDGEPVCLMKGRNSPSSWQVSVNPTCSQTKFGYIEAVTITGVCEMQIDVAEPEICTVDMAYVPPPPTPTPTPRPSTTPQPGQPVPKRTEAAKPSGPSVFLVWAGACYKTEKVPVVQDRTKLRLEVDFTFCPFKYTHGRLPGSTTTQLLGYFDSWDGIDKQIFEGGTACNEDGSKFTRAVITHKCARSSSDEPVIVSATVTEDVCEFRLTVESNPGCGGGRMLSALEAEQHMEVMGLPLPVQSWLPPPVRRLGLPLHYPEAVAPRPHLVQDARLESDFAALVKRAAAAAQARAPASIVPGGQDARDIELTPEALAAARQLPEDVEALSAELSAHAEIISARRLQAVAEREEPMAAVIPAGSIPHSIPEPRADHPGARGLEAGTPADLLGPSSVFPPGTFEDPEEEALHWNAHLLQIGRLRADEVDMAAGARRLQEVRASRVKPSATPSPTPSSSPGPTASNSLTPSSSRSSTPTMAPSDRPRPAVTGPAALQLFRGKPFSYKYGGFLYEIFPFDRARMTMLSFTGRNNIPIHLGFFTGWNLGKDGDKSVYLSQKFEGGAPCTIPLSFGRRNTVTFRFQCGPTPDIRFLTTEMPACTWFIDASAAQFCGVNMEVGKENAPVTQAGPSPYIGPDLLLQRLDGLEYKYNVAVPGDFVGIRNFDYVLRPLFGVSRVITGLGGETLLGFWNKWDAVRVWRYNTSAVETAYRPVAYYGTGATCDASPSRRYTSVVRYVCPWGVSTLKDWADGKLLASVWLDFCTLSLVVVHTAACGVLPFEGQEYLPALPRIESPYSFSGPRSFLPFDGQCMLWYGAVQPYPFGIGATNETTPLINVLPLNGTAPMLYSICPFGESRVYPTVEGTAGPYYTLGYSAGWFMQDGGGGLPFYRFIQATSGLYCNLAETYHRVIIRFKCDVGMVEKLESVVASGPCEYTATILTSRACGISLEAGQENALNVTVSRTCPLVDNAEGLVWTGDAPPQCSCAGLPGAHVCTADPIPDNKYGSFAPWIFGRADGIADKESEQALTSSAAVATGFGTNGTLGIATSFNRGVWGFTYKIPAGVRWPTPLQGKGSREGILVAPKPTLIFRGHTFKWYLDTDLTDGPKGVIFFRTIASENPWKLDLRVRLQLFGYMADKASIGRPPGYYLMPMEVSNKVDPKLSGDALERFYNSSNINFWRDAHKAIATEHPEAPAYFLFATYDWDFRFEMRFQGADGTPLYKLLAYDPLDGSVPEAIINRNEYHLRRAVITMDFGWLFKWCKKGTYQVGDKCFTCPSEYPRSSGTYNDLDFMADHKLSQQPETRNPTFGDDGICRPMNCKPCETVEPANGICIPKDGACVIFNTCYDMGDRKGTEPNDQCQRCVPAVQNLRWTTVVAANCDDGDACTFFDSCTSNGACVGRKAECLRDSRDPTKNCEICGKNQCDLRPDFGGCVFTRANGTRVCGCKIDGKCWPHGALKPNNMCQQCDVSRSATSWVSTPPKNCNDGIACTHSDICTKGVCRGERYACPLVAGSGLMSCVANSTCKGDGTCSTTFRPAGTVCAEAVGECAQPATCTGSLGYCPLKPNIIPIVTTGDAEIGLRAMRVGGHLAPDCAGTPQLAGSVVPYIEGGVAFPECFVARAFSWNATCGGLTYSVGLQPVDDAATPCDEKLATWGPYTLEGSKGSVFVPGIFPPPPDAEDPLAPPYDGTLFRLIVRGMNIGGTFLAICDDQILVVDKSPPEPGEVKQLDPTLLDAPGLIPRTSGNFHAGDTLRASWEGFAENFTSTWGGMLRYRYRVWTALPASTSASVTVVPRPVVTPANSTGASGNGTVAADNGTVAAGNGTTNSTTPVPAAPLDSTVGSSNGAANGTAVAPEPDAVLEPSTAPLDGWVAASGWVRTNLASSAEVTSAILGLLGPLPTGQWYKVEVEGYNRAGLYATSESEPWLIDRTPAEVVGAVSDGGCTADITSPLTAYWAGAFSDAESGIDHFEVAFGTRPGGLDILGWTPVPGGRNATAYTLPFAGKWQAGIWYYATVRAVSGSGAVAVAPSSPGMLWDTTAPAELALSAPARSPAISVRVQYSYLELESGFGSVRLWAGSTPGASNVARPVEFAGLPFANVATLPLTGTVDKQVVHVCVQIINRAGVASPEVCSGGIRLDAAVPTVGFVRNLEPQVRTSPQSSSYHTGAFLSVLYGPCFNAISGIRSHEVAVFTSGTPVIEGNVPSGTNLKSTFALPWVILPEPDSAAASAGIYFNLSTLVTPRPGWPYVVSVRCTTGASVSNFLDANVLVVDRTAPVISAIGFGTRPGSPLLATAENDRILLSWMSSDPESGVATNEWSFRGGPRGCEGAESYEMVPWTSVGTARVALRTGVTLPIDHFYCAYVRSTNRAGLVSVARSAALRVDSTPPVVVGTVRDGGRGMGATEDLDFASDVYRVGADWNGTFTDPETGNQMSYAWCAGTSVRGCDIFPLTFVGAATSAVATVQRTLHKRRVFVSVAAYQAANLSTIATSDGLDYDLIPPAGGDGTLLDVAVPSIPAELSAFFANKIALPSEEPAAGNATASASPNPFALTRTPDDLLWAAEELYLSPASDPTAHINGSMPLRIALSGFPTNVAPLREYWVSVGSAPGMEDLTRVHSRAFSPLVALPTFDATTTARRPGMLPARDGQRYYTNVIAATAGGANVSVTVTKTFTWDGSPPTNFIIGLANPVDGPPATPRRFVGGAQQPEFTAASATELLVCISAASDPHSGVAAAHLQIRACAPGATCGYVTLDNTKTAAAAQHRILLPAFSMLRPAGAADAAAMRRCTNITFDTPLPIGTPLAAEVTLINGAGLGRTVSAPLRVDTTPPVMPGPVFVAPAWLPETADAFAALELRLRWLAPFDAESPCCTYRILLGSTQRGSELGVFEPTASEITSSTLQSGQGLVSTVAYVVGAAPGTVHVTVEAVNAARLVTVVPASTTVQHTATSAALYSPVALRSGDAEDRLQHLNRTAGVRSPWRLRAGADTVTVQWSVALPGRTPPQSPAPDAVVVQPDTADFSYFTASLTVRNGSASTELPVVNAGTQRRAVFRLPAPLAADDTVFARVFVYSANLGSTLSSVRGGFQRTSTNFTAEGVVVAVVPVPTASSTVLVAAGAPSISRSLQSLSPANTSLALAWRGLTASTIRAQGLGLEIALGTSAGANDILPFTAVRDADVVDAGSGSDAFTSAVARGIVLPTTSGGAASRPISATLRITDLAGNRAQVNVGSLSLVSGPPSGVGFQAWNTRQRRTVRSQVSPTLFAASWTRPGGAATAAAVTSLDSTLVPGGLSHYALMVTLAEQRDTSVEPAADPTVLGVVVLAAAATDGEVTLTQPVPDGSIVYVRVEAVSKAGLATGVSVATAVEVSSPQLDSLWQPRFSSDPQGLTVRWLFQAPLALSYNAALCSRAGCPRGSELSPSLDSGGKPSMTWTGLKLREGARLAFAVTACNAAGSCVTASTRAGEETVVSFAAPIPGRVGFFPFLPNVKVDGDRFPVSDTLPAFLNPEVAMGATRTDKLVLTAVWEPFLAPSPDVGLGECSVRFGEGPGSDSLFSGPCTHSAGFASAMVDPSGLSHGTYLYATVTVSSVAGVAVSSSSQQMLVDLTPPSPFNVTVPLEDRLLQTAGEGFRCRFSVLFDPDSGIKDAYVGAGRIPGTVNAIPWAKISGEELAAGEVRVKGAGGVPMTGLYYCAISALNFAGLNGSVWAAEPAIVDPTPPTITGAKVFDGPDPLVDVAWMPPANMRPANASDPASGRLILDVSITWFGFEDAESDIAFYEVGLITGLDLLNVPPGIAVQADLAPFRVSPTLSSYTFADVTVDEYRPVYAVVRATNRIGLTSEVVVSSGQTLDRSPPVISAWALQAQSAAFAAAVAATAQGEAAFGFVLSVGVNEEDTAKALVLTETERTALFSKPLLTIGAPHGAGLDDGTRTSCVVSSRAHEVLAVADSNLPAQLLKAKASATPRPSPSATRTPRPSFSATATRTPTPSSTPDLVVQWGDVSHGNGGGSGGGSFVVTPPSSSPTPTSLPVDGAPCACADGSIGVTYWATTQGDFSAPQPNDDVVPSAWSGHQNDLADPWYAVGRRRMAETRSYGEKEEVGWEEDVEGEDVNAPLTPEPEPSPLGAAPHGGRRVQGGIALRSWCHCPSAAPSPVPVLASNGKSYTTPAQYEADTDSAIVFELGVAVKAACKAGFERVDALGACLPCAEGFYKPAVGDASCQACPAGTADEIRGRLLLITDSAERSKTVDTSTRGATTCGCIDRTQVFVQGQGCVCAPGFLPRSPTLQSAIQAAYRGVFPFSVPGVDPAEATMCVRVTGNRYKLSAGNAQSLARACPADSVVEPNRTTCVCIYDQEAFDPSTGTCGCKPGTYLTTGAERGACSPCPARTFKASAGNSGTLCIACPTGAVPTLDASNCTVDHGLLEGGAYFPPATGYPAGFVACPPGTAPNAVRGRDLRPGVLVELVDGDGGPAVSGQVCVDPPLFVQPAPLPDGTLPPRWRRYDDGVLITLVPGVELTFDRFHLTNYLNGYRRFGEFYAFSTYLSFLNAVNAIPAGQARVRVVSNTCTLPVRGAYAQCVGCPSGTWQPYVFPWSGFYSQFRASGPCGACPSLTRGSYFAASNATLYISWQDMFADSGVIASFSVAVGTVMGGSQVVPFTTFPGDATSAVFANVSVGPGEPMFATIVAADGAGNQALFRDTRPVFYDASAPLGGAAVDMDLDSYWAAVLAADGTAARNATVLGGGNMTAALLSYRASVAGDMDPQEAAAAQAQAFLDESRAAIDQAKRETGGGDSGSLYFPVARRLLDRGYVLPPKDASGRRLRIGGASARALLDESGRDPLLDSDRLLDGAFLDGDGELPPALEWALEHLAAGGRPEDVYTAPRSLHEIAAEEGLLQAEEEARARRRLSFATGGEDEEEEILRQAVMAAAHSPGVMLSFSSGAGATSFLLPMRSGATPRIGAASAMVQQAIAVRYAAEAGRSTGAAAPVGGAAQNTRRALAAAAAAAAPASSRYAAVSRGLQDVQDAIETTPVGWTGAVPLDSSGTVSYSCPAGATCDLAAGFCRAWRGSSSPPAARYSVVAMGARHGCAITAEGLARCWGDNGSGQAPTIPVGGSEAFRHIAVSDAGCSCGLTDAGILQCWGERSDANSFCLSVYGGANSAAATLKGKTISHFSLPPKAKFLVAIDSTGAAYCIGGADATAACYTGPASATLVQASAQDNFVCFLTSTGAAECGGPAYAAASVTATTLASASARYSQIATTPGEFGGVYASTHPTANNVGSGIAATEGPVSAADRASTQLSVGVLGGSARDGDFSTAAALLNMTWSDPLPRRARLTDILGFGNPLATADAKGIMAERGFYVLDEQGSVASFRGDSVATQAGKAATNGPYGALGGVHGVRAPSGTAYAGMVCAVTCTAALDCWGEDAQAIPLQPPAELFEPCALRLPMAVGAAASARAVQCTQSSAAVSAFQVAAATPVAAPDAPQVCSLAGLWQWGLLRFSQRPGSLDVGISAVGIAGSTQLTNAKALLPGGLASASLRLQARPAFGARNMTGGNVTLFTTETVSTASNPNATVLGGVTAINRLKEVRRGTLLPNCSHIVWDDGTPAWTAQSRCRARFIAIRKGSSIPDAYAAPAPFSIAPYGVSASRLDMRGPEVLALADLQVLNSGGDSLLAAMPPSAVRLVPSSARSPAANLLDASNATSFITSSSWGNASAGAAGPAVVQDPNPFVIVDLGYEAPVSTIRLTRPTSTNPAVDTAWGYQLAGLEVLGFPASSAGVFAAAAAAAGSDATAPAKQALGYALGSLPRSWRITVRGSQANGFNPYRSTYSWGGIETSCGYEPVPGPSVSPSPSFIPTPSAALTPSATSTRTRSATSTRTATATSTTSRSQTPSATATASSSVSPSRSQTPSNSPTPTPTPTPVPSFRLGFAAPPEEAFLEAPGGATALMTTSGLYREWRRNSTWHSLAGVPDAEWSADTSTTMLAWEPFTDVASGIAALAYCWGSKPFLCDIVGWQSVDLRPSGQQARLLVDSAVAGNLSIASGTTVYGSVAATNYVGFTTIVVTDGMVVDDAPPAIDTVLDTGRYFLQLDVRRGSGTVENRAPSDIDCDIEGMGVGATWRDTVSTSGIGQYYWSVGTSPGAADILPWTDVGQSIAVYNSSLTLPPGLIYYTSVKAVGVTGKTAIAHSDGVRVLSSSEATDRMVCAGGN